MEGWVKIHRKFMDSAGYFSEPFCRNMAWVDLLLLCNHDDNFFRVRGIKIDVKRGECGHSESTLAERWGWSRGKVRRFIIDLQKEGRIVQQKSSVINLISIIKYNEYQADGTTNRTTKRTTDGQQTVQQTDTNKNDKNDKKNTREQVPSSVNPDFDVFQKWCLVNAERVLKMKEPITQLQFLELKEKFDAKEIAETLKSMHNWEPLLKKNVSAYLTITNWIKKDDPKPTTGKLASIGSAPLKKITNGF